MLIRRVLFAALVLSLTPLLPAVGAPACVIVEGSNVQGVQVGVAVERALAVTGAPVRQQTQGTRAIYDLSPPWTQVVAEYGIVVRVSTRMPDCRTVRGTGPGSTRAEVRSAHAGAMASGVFPATDGEWLAYPMEGIAYLMRRDRVEQVDIFRGADIAQTVPRSPGSPVPTSSPTTWQVKEASARLDGTALIVTGMVENGSRARTVYAEVHVFDEGGRVVGQGEAPLRPNPVPTGGRATFEVRVQVQEVPRRFSVFIRPMEPPSTILAQHTAELKDLGEAGPLVARQLRVSVQPTTPVPNPRSFVVVVTNGSQLTVASVRVTVQMTATCRVPVSNLPRQRGRVLLAAGALFAPGVLAVPSPAPTPTPPPSPGPTPSPRPTPRTIQETWNGIATVQQIRPGASTQALLQLSGGVCLEFTSWTATTQVGEVKIAPN